LPYIFCSYFWNKVNKIYYYGKRKNQRVHGDQLQVGPESPDAFEEIFWSRYIENYRGSGFKKILNYEYKNRKLYEFIDINIKKIIFIREKSKTFLSKGNYLIFRLKYIFHNHPKTKIILCIRNPIKQCLSAVKINEEFINQNYKNNFFSLQSDFLCHFEFGHNRKSIIPSNNKKKFLTKSRLQNYVFYLTEWIYTYELVIKEYLNDDKFLQNILIVNYDKFIKNKYHATKKMLDFCKLETNNEISNFIQYSIYENNYNKFKLEKNYKIRILEKKANKIYNTIIQKI